jgi:DNA-binding SARP family transcriptional activator
MADETIENLRERLARQILENALDSDNPQFKVDAFKALEKWGMTRASSAPAKDADTSPMAAFQGRVKRAEQGVDTNGESPASDT